MRRAPAALAARAVDHRRTQLVVRRIGELQTTVVQTTERNLTADRPGECRYR
jgi:hypothetical protein